MQLPLLFLLLLSSRLVCAVPAMVTEDVSGAPMDGSNDGIPEEDVDAVPEETVVVQPDELVEVISVTGDTLPFLQAIEDIFALIFRLLYETLGVLLETSRTRSLLHTGREEQNAKKGTTRTTEMKTTPLERAFQFVDQTFVDLQRFTLQILAINSGRARRAASDAGSVDLGPIEELGQETGCGQEEECQPIVEDKNSELFAYVFANFRIIAELLEVLRHLILNLTFSQAKEIVGREPTNAVNTLVNMFQLPFINMAALHPDLQIRPDSQLGKLTANNFQLAQDLLTNLQNLVVESTNLGTDITTEGSREPTLLVTSTITGGKLVALGTSAFTINSLIAAPAVALGAKLAAPGVFIGSKLAAPVVTAAGVLAAPALKVAAPVLAPGVKVASTLAGPAVNAVKVATAPLKPALSPLKKAASPLGKAFKPIAKAFKPTGNLLRKNLASADTNDLDQEMEKFKNLFFGTEE